MKITAYRTTMPFLDNQLSPLTNKSRALEIDRDYERGKDLDTGFGDHKFIPKDYNDPSFAAIQPPFQGEWRWDRTGIQSSMQKDFVAYIVGGPPIPYKNKSILEVIKDLKDNGIKWRLISTYVSASSSDGIKVFSQENGSFISKIAMILSSSFKVESKSIKNKVLEIGSAFYIKPNHLITCAHVVSRKKEDPSEIALVVIDGGHRYPARVVEIDYDLDIALLYCDSIQHTEIGSKSIKDIPVGQEIICVGSPYGYDNNVTKGILSSKDRKIESGDVPYFFMDLAVYPGSSGGPVVDVSDGKVIGLAAVIIESVGNYGLNAGIPIDVCLNRFSKMLYGDKK